jgi:hypothetical protein
VIEVYPILHEGWYPRGFDTTLYKDLEALAP